MSDFLKRALKLDGPWVTVLTHFELLSIKPVIIFLNQLLPIFDNFLPKTDLTGTITWHIGNLSNNCSLILGIGKNGIPRNNQCVETKDPYNEIFS